MNRNQIRMLAAEHPVGHPFRGPAFGERCDPVSIGVGLVGSMLMNSMSDKGGGNTAAPALAAPTRMPTPDDDAMKAAQRKQMQALQERRGRASTILDNGTSGDLLGA